MAIELITQAEYAKRRGCSQVAVHKAVKAGRIMLIDGKIDPSVADVQWAKNTRARVGSHSTSDTNLSAPAKPEDDGDDYWKSRGRREKAEAELAELKLAEQLGQLVRAADVRASVSKRAAALRESFLQLPARVVPLLAADPSPAMMDQILRAEIVAALAQLTEG